MEYVSVLKIVIEYYCELFGYMHCAQRCSRVTLNGTIVVALHIFFVLEKKKNLCKIQLQSDLSFPTCTINRLPNIELLHFLGSIKLHTLFVRIQTVCTHQMTDKK